MLRLVSCLEIWEENQLVMKDSFNLEGDRVKSKVGMDAGVFGILVLIGHRTSSVCSLVESLHHGRDKFDTILSSSCTEDKTAYKVSVSRLLCNAGPAVIVRFTAIDIEHGYSLLHKLLSPLEDMLGFQPYSDRLFSNNYNNR